MKLFIVLIFSAGFCWLAEYSLEQGGYEASDIQGMEQIVASTQYDDTPESKAVYLWGAEGQF